MPRRTNWTWVALHLLIHLAVAPNATDASVPSAESAVQPDDQQVSPLQTAAPEAKPLTQAVSVEKALHKHSLVPCKIQRTCSDQIVLVSTRNYPNIAGRLLDFRTFVGFQCNANGTCTGRPIDLFGEDRAVETWVFVHGNQIPAQVAIERGTRVYRQLRCRSSQCRPIRFIIYSWPSERETLRITDTGIKVRRTNAESFYFGSFLSAISCQGPVNIVAYSFGARITCGGLHLLNGGSLDGRCLPDPQAPMCSIRLAMLAAAVESDGILPGGRYDRALRSCDKLLLLNNSRDHALRFFWFIDRSRPRALGRTGLKNSPYGCSVVQYDWEKQIGKDHSIWNYFDRQIIVDRILQNFAR